MYGGGKSWAQTWISAVSATTTANTAKITWVTAVAADSQVEYGTTAAYGSVTTLAAAKLAIHAAAIGGLTGGTTYHFRVRSSDATGSLVVGQDYALTVSIPITVSLSPQSATIAANGTQQFTATVGNDSNHAVSWSATAGSVSSSGLFTAPNASSITAVTITATSHAGTASVTLQIGAAQSVGTMLLGHSTLETQVNGLYDGMVEGYQMTASGNGTLSTLSVYGRRDHGNESFCRTLQRQQWASWLTSDGGTSATFRKQPGTRSRYLRSALLRAANTGSCYSVLED